MKQLIPALFVVGAVMLLIGAAVYVTGWQLSPYIYTVGATFVALAQINSPSQYKTPTIRRLRRQQIFGALLLVLTGAFMPSFFLSFFSLHVSVLFPSCVIFPVSLYLVSDTRVSDVPRPGCRTCRDPGVEHAETRVSYNALPYLRIFFQPSVVSFRAHAHIL